MVNLGKQPIDVKNTSITNFSWKKSILKTDLWNCVRKITTKWGFHKIRAGNEPLASD